MSSSRNTSSGDSAHEQDLHAVDTVLLATTRARWDERPTAEDKTRIDQRAFEDRTAPHIREIPVAEMPPSSREITAEAPRAVESSPLPTAEPGSNPEPTMATKLDPGIAHLVPGTLVDEFVIDRLLGSGAMGQVYGAQHERLGKRVAIKVIAPSLCRDRGAVERFEQESVALARITHPNIVGVISVGTLPGDGRSYYAMEWIDGESLQARIDREPVPVDLALDVLDQIARGLEAAHAAGIVHRDMKPDNVFLQRVGDEPRPLVRLVDLGLAKLAEHRRSEETQVGVLFGTPQYMSPEQCQSARDVGPATDIYALGAIAYELLCGRLPFVYDNVAELIAAHQIEEPPRPRELSSTIDPRLDQLMIAMIAKDPMQRPTLAVVRSTLAAVRAEPPTRASRTSSTITAPRTAARLSARSRRGLLVAIAGFTLLSFLVASALMRSRTDEAETHAAAHVDASAPRTDPPRPPETSATARLVDAGVTAQVPDTQTRGRVPILAREAAVRVDAGTAVAPDAAELVTSVADAGCPVDESSHRQEMTPTADSHGAERVPVPPRGNREPQHSRDQTTTQPARDPRDRTYDPFHRSSPR